MRISHECHSQVVIVRRTYAVVYHPAYAKCTMQGGYIVRSFGTQCGEVETLMAFSPEAGYCTYIEVDRSMPRVGPFE